MKKETLLVNIPEELLLAIDSPKFYYYVLQGGWAFGKTVVLELLKTMLDQYISDNNLNWAVIMISNASSGFGDAVDDLIKFNGDTKLSDPRRLMRRLLSNPAFKKILLIDSWQNITDERAFDFTFPINSKVCEYQNTTQIVAGSEQSSLFKPTEIKEKLVKLVPINILTKYEIISFILHFLPDYDILTHIDIILCMTGGILFYVDMITKSLLGGEGDLSIKFAVYTGLKISLLKSIKGDVIGKILDLLYSRMPIPENDANLQEFRILDSNGLLLPSFERGFVRYLHSDIIVNLIANIYKPVSTHLFESSLVPITLKDLDKITLITHTKSNASEPHQKKKKLNIERIEIAISNKRSVYDNEASIKLFNVWCNNEIKPSELADLNVIYYLPPRFYAIDAFIIDGEFVYAMRFSPSKYGAYDTRKLHLRTKMKTDADEFLKIGDSVNDFLLRISGLGLVKQIRYVFVSVKFANKEDIWEFEENWITSAFKNYSGIRTLYSASGLI